MNLKFHTEVSPKYSICEEDIFGVIKEHNYYLDNKYASHFQRFQITYLLWVKSSLQKFYGRHHGLMDRYEIFIF
jgi:hypothetical protein